MDSSRKLKDNILQQKSSRLRWVKDGDSNLRFFHAAINRNRKRLEIPGLKINRNRKRLEIPGLKINDQWVEDPEYVKDYIKESDYCLRKTVQLVAAGTLRISPSPGHGF
ncbi:hypothetical protein RIF29_17615 [Crotalaria pallida]|uniref:Uncharacterized protein n=1 Tax=Crotalaria pallida TaxID=3830 RepID=A0AAN9IGL4_CROPI